MSSLTRAEEAHELNWYRMVLDKAIAEYEESAKAQKELMDEGNSFAAGRWIEMKDIARYLKWMRNYD